MVFSVNNAMPTLLYVPILSPTGLFFPGSLLNHRALPSTFTVGQPDLNARFRSEPFGIAARGVLRTAFPCLLVLYLEPFTQNLCDHWLILLNARHRNVTLLIIYKCHQRKKNHPSKQSHSSDLKSTCHTYQRTNTDGPPRGPFNL